MWLAHAFLADAVVGEDGTNGGCGTALERVRGLRDAQDSGVRLTNRRMLLGEEGLAGGKDGVDKIDGVEGVEAVEKLVLESRRARRLVTFDDNVTGTSG